MSCMELKHVFADVIVILCFNAIFIDTVDGFYILYWWLKYVFPFEVLTDISRSPPSQK